MKKKTTSPAAKKPAATAKKSNGINAGLVIPVLFVVGYLIYKFILGDASNFNEEGEPKTVLGIVYKGGIIVPILITCLLTVLVFFIERLITVGKAGGSGNLDEFVRKIRTMLDQNNIADALKECDKQKGSVGNVAKTAIEKYDKLSKDNEMAKDQKLVSLQKEIEEATSLELPMLEKNLVIFSTLASVATLIALLGTVIGMIKSFFALGAGGGAPDASALATGIAEALINTALGIGTSAVAIIVYNFFTSKIDGLTYKIDEIGMSLQQNFAAHN